MRAWIVALLLCLVTAPALAQEDEEQAAPRPGADEYTRLVAEGVRLMAGGDTDGALDRLRQAVSMDGERPQAPYYLAVANRVAGAFDEALSGFSRTAQLAERAEEPRWQARALQGVASTLERMDDRLEDAREAWQAYVSFADAHTTVSFPQLGRARIQAIDILTEQETAYVQVRERIAEREREQAEEEQEEGRGRRGRRRRRRRSR